MYSCLPSPRFRLQLLPGPVAPTLRAQLHSQHTPTALARMSTSTQQGINGHASPAAAVPPSNVPAPGQSASSSDDHAPLRTPLSIVVTDAVKRWYIDTNKEAVKGDVKQQALLGQMLLEGYGCEQNQSAARMWIDKAKRRGYRMAGVYCEL